MSTLTRELKRLQAKWDIEIEALHLSGVLIQKQGADGASRSCPWLGLFCGRKSSHDKLSPMEWPRFPLDGKVADAAARFWTKGTVVRTDPNTGTSASVPARTRTGTFDRVTLRMRWRW